MTSGPRSEKTADTPPGRAARPGLLARARGAFGGVLSPTRVLLPNDRVPFRAAQASAKTARIRAFAPLLALVHLLHVALFVPSWNVAGVRGTWAREVALAHGLLAVFASFAFLRSRSLAEGDDPVRTRSRERLVTATAWAYLGLSAWLAGVDQQVTPNVTPYVVGSLAVALTLPLPTLGALACHGAAFALYVVMLGWLQPDGAVRLSNVVNGLTITVFAFGLARFLEGWRAREYADRRTIERQQLALAAANRELARLATNDALTGLPNRRHFLERADELRGLAQRTQRPLAVLVLDVDHFKSVNDTRGHAAGDEVLVAVARAIRHGLRTSDVAGRLGGEEFAALLPDTSLEGAVQVAERLRAAVAAVAVETAPGLRVTMSVGATTIVLEASAPVPEALARADGALYEAKRSGRDRTVARPADGPAQAIGGHA